MQSSRFVLLSFCILGLAAGSFGQQTKAAPAAPKAPAAGPPAESVLKILPAGSLGYVVVNNVQATAGSLDGFLTSVGLSGVVSQQMPNGLLDFITTKAMLGEGFNPNAGFAAVMLDPQQFGVDLVGLMTQGRPSLEGVKLPFALMVPGKGVATVFANYPQSAEGKYTKVGLRMGEVYAAQMDPYVVLSPLPGAMDAIVGAQKKADSELSKEAAAVISRSDVAAQVNMKVAGPLYLRLMEQAEGKMGMGLPVEFKDLFGVYFDIYRQIIPQLESYTVSVRLAKTGLVLEELLAAKPDSDMGKSLAAARPAAAVKLDRVPDLNPVLAFASRPIASAEQRKMTSDILDKLLASQALSKVPDQTRAKAKTILMGLGDEITGVQFAGGGAPEGSGLFGLALVLQCKDSAKVKGMLADATGVAVSMIKALAGEGPDAQGFNISYKADALKVGQTSVDAIGVEIADIANEQENITKVFGEGEIRALVAAPDSGTVVVTFGGAQPFMAEALKAAKGGTDLFTGEAAKEVELLVPGNRTFVGMLNVGNLFTVVANGATAMGEGPPPFSISGKTPIALAGAVEGTSAHVVFYVPNDLIKEVAGAVQMMFTGMMGGRPGGRMGSSPKGAEEF